MKRFFFSFLVIFFSTALIAQSSLRFSIARGVIDAGGTTFSSSQRYQLGSTVAQPAAAVPSSPRYSIQGGFWIRPAPVIFAPQKIGNSFMISIQSEIGKTYTLSCQDSLTASVWQPFTNIAGNGSVITVTNTITGFSQRFFRLEEN
jgi:hypothetical protein